MAHNSTRKPGGYWYDNDALTGADMTYVDQTLYKCLNGDEGGTWSPSSPIIIGGEGIRFSTLKVPVTASESGTIGLRVLAGAHAGETHEYTIADADIILCTGLSVYTIYKLMATSAVEGASITVSLQAPVDNTVTLRVRDQADASLIVLGQANGFPMSARFVYHSSGWVLAEPGACYRITESLLIGDSTTLSFYLGGHIRYRIMSHAAYPSVTMDEDKVITIGQADIWIWDQDLTAIRTWVLSQTGAANGDVIEVARDILRVDCASALRVTNSAGVLLATLVGTGSGIWGARFLYHNGEWIHLSSSKV